MGVEKYTLAEGNGTDVPKKGDNCTLEYTGWLYDASAPNNKKGDPFDSSVGRAPFTTKVGVGKVIKGWDEGIIGTDSKPGMSLGEKATLVISSDYGYGDRGYPGAIPPGSALVFDVELKSINGKTL